MGGECTMTQNEKNTSNIDYGDGSFPNIEKLTALLNQQKHPRRMLQAIILLAKPIPERNDHSRQKP